jgi:ACS family 4-hydroxyphenylacetate permease-like MFS transporter
VASTTQTVDMADVAAGDEVARKVFRRTMWFLFILMVVSFMDRINIAFAGLTMNKDLGLNAAMFGMSVSIFYIGYCLFEIPSNLLLARFGARLWIARIMITWGLASAATALAVGVWSLYGTRFLVGIAEAGFFPGIVFYLTLWFPRAYRARANAAFLVGMPATIAFASALSGLILGLDGFLGLAGWRWLFLLEGLPAVVLGVVCLFFLDDGPIRAKWLSEGEKATLLARLEQDRALEAAGTTKRSVMSQLGSRNVVLLSIAYFGLVSSLNSSTTWTPLIIREFAAGANFASVGLLAAIPALITVAAMLLWGASSDRRNERPWHLRIAMLLAATGWLLVASDGAPALVRFLGLVLVSVGSFCGLLTFWTIPTSAAILSADARPAGIALITSVGIAGGSAVTPAIVGFLKDWSGSFTPGLLFVVTMLFMAVILVTVVTAQQRPAQAIPTPSRA